jgi:hypothetical protein
MGSLTPEHSDPNFPPNLSILPSSRQTSNSLKLIDADSDSEENDAAQDIETYGIAGRTWEAAYLLRQYLTPSPSPSSAEFDPSCPLYSPARSSSTSRQRTILEIGSGTGFLGLSLAPHLLSTDTLVLTDLENVCPLLEKNLSVAQYRWRRRRTPTEEPNCLVRALPWGDSDFLESEIKQPGLLPDYILASDLVYFPFLYPPLLKTLLGLTEWRASDDPRRNGREGKGPTLIFSYKIRSLVREQPFWEAFGRWFKFEAVQVGKQVLVEEEEGGPKEEGSPVASRTETIWSRFGAAHQSEDDKRESKGDSDELYIFIAHRRASTLGISESISRGEYTDEDLMLGRNGLEGELEGGAQFEEMLLASLEWD